MKLNPSRTDRMFRTGRVTARNQLSVPYLLVVNQRVSAGAGCLRAIRAVDYSRSEALHS